MPQLLYRSMARIFPKLKSNTCLCWNIGWHADGFYILKNRNISFGILAVFCGRCPKLYFYLLTPLFYSVTCSITNTLIQIIKLVTFNGLSKIPFAVIRNFLKRKHMRAFTSSPVSMDFCIPLCRWLLQYHVCSAIKRSPFYVIPIRIISLAGPILFYLQNKYEISEGKRICRPST